MTKKQKIDHVPAPPLPMGQRLAMVLDMYQRELVALQNEYDYARKSFAGELTDREGPTWVSSSSETEWRRLRTELWAKREMVKSLQYISEGPVE